MYSSLHWIDSLIQFEISYTGQYFEPTSGYFGTFRLVAISTECLLVVNTPWRCKGLSNQEFDKKNPENVDLLNIDNLSSQQFDKSNPKNVVWLNEWYSGLNVYCMLLDSLRDEIIVFLSLSAG